LHSLASFPAQKDFLGVSWAKPNVEALMANTEIIFFSYQSGF
jgi:hypothetical protein